MDFKFNFSGFKTKTTKVNKQNKILLKKDAVGVIKITLTASYFVDVDNIDYPLTSNSFDVKDKQIYYAKKLQGNRLLNIRRLDKFQVNNNNYIPFNVGSLIKGNIYSIYGKEYFDFKKIIDISDLNEETIQSYINKIKEYKSFYRKNYNEIIKCMD